MSSRPLLVVLIAAACAPRPIAGSKPEEPVASPAEPEPVASAAPTPKPDLEATPDPSPSPDAELVALPVPGHLDSVVVVPRGTVPRPLVVATHGAGGEPEWTCASWARRTGGETFVLCPRGRKISEREPQGYYYPDHFALEAEVLAAVAALEQSLGSRLDSREILYFGYSQGATMGALFLPPHGSRFPRLILTEGGFDSWTLGRASAYAKSGGKRVLFVCGGRGCLSRAQKSAATLERAGIGARAELVEGGGHTDGGPVGERLDRIYRWVFETSRNP